MPSEVFITYAKDSNLESQSHESLVDIHAFNQYFTFQIDQPIKQEFEPSSIETSFQAPISSGEGFIIKLRSELSSAFSDQVQQGMRVTIIDKSKGGGILVDATSLDNNQGAVHLEYAELKDGIEYTIRYDLYDKELVSNDDIGELTSSNTNVLCKLPFITQELLIIDKKLAKHRVAQYNRNPDKNSIDLSVGLKCQFDHFNNTIDSEFGEEGIYCDSQVYTYQSSQSTSMSSNNAFKILYQHEFSVRGAKNELITYWYEMLIGLNFMVSSSLKILLTRNDKEFDERDPFKCLYDKSCVLATMSEKNQVKIDLILTSGLYKLVFLEDESSQMRKFFNSEADLDKRPFTFSLTSYPVLQNEERDFIQQRFVEGKNGKRFTMTDKIIMNIFNLTQQFDLKPEADSLLKIRIKESFGVNTELVLCQGQDCLTMSTQIGTSEILFAKVKKGLSYYVELSFAHSLIQISEFFQCPHFNIEISMISTSDAQVLIKESDAKADDFENQEKLSQIFNNITKGDATEGYAFIDHETIFRFNADQSKDLERTLNQQVTSVKFIATEKLQLYSEIFYDPFFYDLEISVVSNDATNVRAHLSSAKPTSKLDWSLYKGSKQLHIELEPGSYDMTFVQKLPPISNSELTQFIPKTVQFQFYLIYAKYIDRQQIMPPSLNYFGLLGPKGTNFGELVYYCQDCVIENILYKSIDFIVADENQDINFNAMISSTDNNVEINFELIGFVDQTIQNKNGDYETIFDLETKKGQQVGQKRRVSKGRAEENEESITAEKLKAHQKYRIVLLNKGESSKQTFNLRLEIIEQPKNIKHSNSLEILPKDIKEIKRDKLRSEGMKESDFLIGSRFMLKWIDEHQLYPFIRKSRQVYQTQYKTLQNDPFLINLKFEVTDEQAQIYASVFDYSGIASLGLTIVKADDMDDDWEIVSIPGKYHSYIPPVSLTKGFYFLVISPMTQFAYDEADMIKFSVDFLFDKENVTDFMQEMILNTMELCNLPSLPKVLSGPQYIHALSGNSLQNTFKIKLMDVLMDDSVKFEVLTQSLVVIYLELPKDLNADIQISKDKGSFKRKVASKEFNQNADNFLKVKGFKHLNVIQLREFLNPGTYTLKINTLDHQGFSALAIPRCSSTQLSISISPTKTATTKLSEQCTQTISMGNKLSYGEHHHGPLVFNSANRIFDTSYVNLEDQGEGPFFIYFQLNYDQMIEGALGLALYKYDRDTTLFEETMMYIIQDSQSYQLAIVSEGVYVISIQSMSNSAEKYTKTTIVGKQDLNPKLLQSPCLNAKFSYYITSAINHDSQQIDLSFTDLLVGLFSGFDSKLDTIGKQRATDMTLRSEFQDILSPTCKYEEIPKKLEATESGYDLTYNFMFNRKAYELIDIIVEEDSLLKVFFNIDNPKNNLNAFLYENSELKNLITFTSPSHNLKELSLALKYQKKAYKLKIVQDSIDESDPCPTYQMRVALKPFNLIIDENLKCSGKQMPPNKITVDKANFDLDGEYQVSSEFIEKYLKQNNDMSYDIEIKVPDFTKEYYFDIETKFDFLTTEVKFSLLGQDSKHNNELIMLSESQWLNQNQGDASLTMNDQSKNMMERLKLSNIKELLSDSQKLTDTYVLRLKFSKRHKSLIQMLKTRSLITDTKLACFTFDLSLRVTQVVYAEVNYTPGSDPTENELIRIDWSSKLQEQLFDSRQKLSVFLQFKESMKEEYKTLKFTPFAYLYPEDIKTQDQLDKRIYPQTTRLSTVDKSSMILTFQHNSLAKGTCYKLVLDVQQLGVRYEESAFKDQNRICTSSCVCNLKGMKECDEQKSQCICHSPFTGPDCGQCIEGFFFNQNTQDCHPATRCKANGGSEDCNNHGTCYEDEKTGLAKCQCEKGFHNDGLDLCGKCTDPLFTYPFCESRNWIVEPSQYNCDKLPTKLPTYLYNKQGQNLTRIYQNAEGLASWAGVYSLIKPKNGLKLRTYHFFTVPSNSILRLFLDNHDSGVQIRFRLIDDKKRLIARSSLDKFKQGYQGDVNVEMLFLQLKQTEMNPQDNPYTLEIEYEFVNIDLAQDKCHMIEIYMIVQPQEKIQNYLKCTDEENQEAQASKQFDFRFNYDPYFFNEKFTLTSDMKAKIGQNYIKEENEQYLILKFDISAQQSGNALSVITSYSFEKVVLELTLVDKKTNNLIAIEKYASLEDIENLSEDFSMSNDMLSYIEVPSLDQGDYSLEILVEKELFLQQTNILTCLSFDLTIEYVSRKTSSSSNDDQYEIVSVLPSETKNMKRSKKSKILVKFNKDFNLDTLNIERSEIDKIFYLESSTDSQEKIYPSSVLSSENDGLILYFNFANAKIPNITTNQEQCYKLVVKNDIIKPLNVETNYCFQSVQQSKDEIKCNPNSMAKLVKNQCLCNYPYKGSTCEQCSIGYNPSLDLNKHTVCVLDLTQCSQDICNNHGSCQQTSHTNQLSDFTCKCTDKYEGMYCGKCKDPKYAYPDCQTILSDVFDTALEHNYLSRRQYNQEGYQRDRRDTDFVQVVEGRKKQQCQISTYPQDLDRVEFMGVFKGEMHIADFYTINHDRDNVIKFTPQSQGFFKILIQEPELEEVKVNDETFDLEIALYDPEHDKFLASSMNQKIDFKENKELIKGKLDYTWLQIQIPYDQVGKTLYIIFRAVNFKVKGDESLTGCETVFIEIQYSETERFSQDNPSHNMNDNQVIRVDANTPYKTSSDKQTFTLKNNHQTFFYYQDFYLGDHFTSRTDDNEQDYEVKISVQQKFMETNLIDFMIEILEEGIAYGDIDFRKYQNSLSQEPQCKLLCLPSGQKTFNEFHNVVQVTAKSLVRVWLHQTTKEGQFANYQLFIEANRINLNTMQIKSLNEVKCEELDLPMSLNINRYLGETSKQQNFHYLERFRVDNLKNNTAHTINFELYEPTLIRIVTTVHKHIEYDLILKQVMPSQTKKLVDSKAKGYEDSILAQLDKGTYQIQVMFLSEEFYLQQPCQSILMEMAMTKVKEIKQQLSQQNQRIQDKSLQLDELLQHKDRQIQVTKSQAISFYNMNDKSLASSYTSYVDLFSQRFSIPKIKDLGLMITIRSDFTLNNVNFALTNINNDRLLHNTRRENMVQLVADNIPGGDYELLVYAHNCLSNIEGQDSLKNLDVSFQIDFNFIKWTIEDDFIPHQIFVEIADKTIKAEIDTLNQRELKCFQDYVLLESEIRPSVINGKVDVNNEVMIPMLQKYQHVMEYTPKSNQDGLRIIIDRSNTNLILRDINSKQILFESFATNAGQQQILLASDLKQDNKYYLRFDFNQDKNTQEFQTEPCQHFRLQIESFNTKDQCQSNTYEEHTSTLTVQGKFSKNVRLASKLQHTSQIVELKDNSTDLQITIDYSNLFYIPTLKLTKKNSRSLNSINEIKPTEITTDIQDRVVYKYANLKNTTYSLNLTQVHKPKNCFNSYSVEIQAEPTDIDLVLQRTSYGMIKTYTSQDEIQSMNRYVQSLPISLDTYKYLMDDEYLLVSEYIQLQSDNIKENKITFRIRNVDANVKSFLRVYLENNEIMMDLRSKTQGKDIERLKTNTIVSTLSNGEYELTFDFSTDQAKQKANFFKNSVHITILITSQPFFEQKYVKQQGDAFNKCETNTNLPLALSKKVELQLSPNEIVYDYQYLRLSDSVLSEKYLIDSYKFRVNETSRFYMAFGMHTIAHQIYIRVSELTDFGNSYIGKQEFNLNVIDIVLSPGDYSMEIEQPTPSKWQEYTEWNWLQGKNEVEKIALKKEFEICGIFSFQGKITPLSDLGEIGGQMAQSKCEIKEVLPTKIYKSVTKTKNGLEFYINQEGSFSKMFENIHIKKNKNSQTMPEYDRIELESLEDGILSVMLQYKSKANSIMVKLFDGFSFVDKSYEPFLQTQAESSNSMMEEQFGFKVVKNKQYFLFVYYKGERQLDPNTNEEQCEYYNFYMSIETMTRLQLELQCLDQSNTQVKVKNYDSDMPKTINDRDLKNGVYTYKEFTELRYPADYERMTSKDEQGLITKKIEIKMNDKFNIDTSVIFDFPYSFFDINLFDNIKSDDNDPNSQATDYEAVAEQFPIQYNSKDMNNPSLSRQIKTQSLRANNVYYLMFSDETSWFILDTVYQHLKQPLCLYTEIQITVTKEQSELNSMVLSSTPQILMIAPLATSLTDAPIMLPRNQDEIGISLEFSTAPFSKNSQIKQGQKIATKAQMAELFTLQIMNPLSKDISYTKRPARIIIDGSNTISVTLIFNLRDEIQPDQPEVLMKLNCDLSNLVDAKSKHFTLKQGLYIPSYTFQEKQDFKQKKKQDEHQESEINLIKHEVDLQNQRNRDMKLNRDKTVKCLCVHGKCKDGEIYCNKCDLGWSGRLCDIKEDAKNINNNEGEDNIKKNKLKTDGSRLNRNRDIDEYTETDRMKERERKIENKQSKDTSYIQNDFMKEKEIYKQQAKKDEIQLLQNDEQESEGFITKLLKVIWEMMIVLMVIFGVVVLAFLLLKKSKLKEYMPLPINENDDSGPQRSLELTDFRNEKRDRRSKQEQKPVQLRTLEFPQDIRGQISQPQNTSQVKQRDDLFILDEETHHLSNELELFGSDHDSGSKLREQDSPYKDDYYQEDQPQHINEIATSNEIESVLNEMKDLDDDDDYDDELRRFV